MLKNAKKKSKVEYYENGNVKYSKIDGIEKWFNEEGKIVKYQNSEKYSAEYEYKDGELVKMTDSKGFVREYVNGKVVEGSSKIDKEDVEETSKIYKKAMEEESDIEYNFKRSYDSEGNPIRFEDNKGNIEERSYRNGELVRHLKYYDPDKDVFKKEEDEAENEVEIETEKKEEQ